MSFVNFSSSLIVELVMEKALVCEELEDELYPKPKTLLISVAAGKPKHQFSGSDVAGTDRMTGSMPAAGLLALETTSIVPLPLSVKR